MKNNDDISVWSVVDDRDRITTGGLTRREANELVRKLIECGREPVELSAGITEWYTANYPNFSSYDKGIIKEK